MAGGDFIFQVGDFPPLIQPNTSKPTSIQFSIPAQNDQDIGKISSQPPLTLVSSEILDGRNLQKSIAPIQNHADLSKGKGPISLETPPPQTSTAPKGIEVVVPAPSKNLGVSNPTRIESKVERAYRGSLDLKPRHHIKGIHCISFKVQDKIDLLSRTKNIIIVKFSHNRPRYKDFESFLLGMKFMGNFKVSEFDKKHIFVEFIIFEDWVKLWMIRSCNISGYMARFFSWDCDFNPDYETHVAPVWIHLPGLPLYLFDELAALSMASIFGKPLHIEPACLDHNKVGVLSMCVAMDVRFKGPIEFIVEFVGNSVLVDRFSQKVVYGDIPSFCSNCCHLGHDFGSCKLALKADLRVLIEEKKDMLKDRGLSGVDTNTDIPVVTVFDRIKVLEKKAIEGDGVFAPVGEDSSKMVCDIGCKEVVTVESISSSEDEGSFMHGTSLSAPNPLSTELQMKKSLEKGSMVGQCSRASILEEGNIDFDGMEKVELGYQGFSHNNPCEMDKQVLVDPTVPASVSGNGGTKGLQGRTGDVAKWLGKRVLDSIEANLLQNKQKMVVSGVFDSPVATSNSFDFLADELDKEGTSSNSSQQGDRALCVDLSPSLSEQGDRSLLCTPAPFSPVSTPPQGLNKHAKKKWKKKKKTGALKGICSVDGGPKKQVTVSHLAEPFSCSPPMVGSVFDDLEENLGMFTVESEDEACTRPFIPRHSRLHPSYLERKYRNNSLDYLDLQGVCAAKDKGKVTKGYCLFETPSKDPFSLAVSNDEDLLVAPPSSGIPKGVIPQSSTSWSTEMEEQDKAESLQKSSASKVEAHDRAEFDQGSNCTMEELAIKITEKVYEKLQHTPYANKDLQILKVVKDHLAQLDRKIPRNDDFVDKTAEWYKLVVTKGTPENDHAPYKEYKEYLSSRKKPAKIRKEVFEPP